ncbi:hypothetical protein AFLA_013154 [Aspergillus flavus NRRL3357]|nr:hypothetical protein AFLA_013154 [Aspergillus flavus NRRL3357]
MINTEYDVTSIAPILQVHPSDGSHGSLVMLRTNENQPKVFRGLVSQAGPRNTHRPVENTVTSQSMPSVAASSSERCDTGSISDVEKGHIYDEWIRAGKPHNLVCSGCRYPGNLLLCETCCRSYHGPCLPSQDASLLTGSFHCPSCRHKRTPGVNGYSRVTSPREYASIDGRRTLAALGPLAGPTQVEAFKECQFLQSATIGNMQGVKHSSALLSRKLLGAIALTFSFLNQASGQDTGANEFDVLDYVDPLIGTSNGGHSFAGATLPFGMAKAVADTQGENQAGFAFDTETVTGFSHTHDSGTGGSPSMGNFPIFAQPNCPDDDLNQCKWQQNDRAVAWVRDSPKARPGYFSIAMENGVQAEMTVTNHSALYRFTFNNVPTESLSPVILVDLMDLPQSRKGGIASVDSSGRLTGNATFNPSFGIGSYELHFCVDFKGGDIRDTGTWVKNRANSSQKTVSLVEDGSNTPATLSAGTFARFHTLRDNTITARVGVSFMSVEQACSNAETELPNFDFANTVSAAESAWRDKLNVISVNAEGISSDLQKVFWSGAYRAMISPQDYTGENPLWKSEEPYYDSFYCIWDSYRGVHQLLTLMDPLSQSRMIRSLVDIYRHEGYLPDCRMSLCKGYTQGGSNADVLIADAFLKNVSDVDWDTAYEAIVKDAEVEPANWGVEGRGGLRSWKGLGYIPTDDYDPDGSGLHTRSISRTVEYAYNDFCIAEVAKRMGHDSDYEKYLMRASNWQNMFKDDQRSTINGVDTGYVGFMQPRYLNGTWGYQDPIFCSPLMNFTSCYLNPDGHETYEGSSWLYTFYAPQDMSLLIKRLGGAQLFTSRLNYLHDSGILYVGDEQAFLTVFQFHYAGRPALSAARSHFYIPSQFNTSVSGIPGNDDGGAMGSFAVLSMIGLFPVHGQDVYLITPPFFKEISIRNSVTGAVATIRNLNFDPTYKAIYIQSATRDGKPWTKNWIGHDFFNQGGVLELELGLTESAWGTQNEDLPPSMSHY